MDLSDIIGDPTDSDMTVLTAAGTICVHKLILKHVSELVQDICADFAGTDIRLDLTAYEHHHVQLALRIMYGCDMSSLGAAGDDLAAVYIIADYLRAGAVCNSIIDALCTLDHCWQYMFDISHISQYVFDTVAFHVLNNIENGMEYAQLQLVLSRPWDEYRRLHQYAVSFMNRHVCMSLANAYCAYHMLRTNVDTAEMYVELLIMFIESCRPVHRSFAEYQMALHNPIIAELLEGPDTLAGTKYTSSYDFGDMDPTSVLMRAVMDDGLVM